MDGMQDLLGGLMGGNLWALPMVNGLIFPTPRRCEPSRAADAGDVRDGALPASDGTARLGYRAYLPAAAPTLVCLHFHGNAEVCGDAPERDHGRDAAAATWMVHPKRGIVDAAARWFTQSGVSSTPRRQRGWFTQKRRRGDDVDGSRRRRGDDVDGSPTSGVAATTWMIHGPLASL